MNRSLAAPKNMSFSCPADPARRGTGQELFLEVPWLPLLHRWDLKMEYGQLIKAALTAKSEMQSALLRCYCVRAAMQTQIF